MIGKKVLTKIVLLLIVLFGVTILTFVYTNLSPVDAAEALAVRRYSRPTAEQIELVREELGLDKPILQQYGSWLWNALHGDFGNSYNTGRSIVEELTASIQPTLIMAVLALLFSTVICIPLGVLSASRKGGLADKSIYLFGIICMSLPNYWIGFMLLLAFAVYLPIFSIMGADSLKDFVLPALALAIPTSAGTIRVFRSSLLDGYNSDFVLYARARGSIRMENCKYGKPFCVTSVNYHAGAELWVYDCRQFYGGECVLHSGSRFHVGDSIKRQGYHNNQRVCIAHCRYLCLGQFPCRLPEHIVESSKPDGRKIMIRKIIHSPQALIGLAMMLIVFLVMVFAPFLAPNDPMQLNVAHSFAPPDTQYPLGTDELGRCVLSRLIYGARESLSIALPTLLLLAIISTVIATLCAYLGGIVDRVFEVVSNIFMAFPPFLVAITLVGLFESKVTSIILSIVIAMWVWNARVVRTHVLRERSQPYVITCRMSGCSELRIVFRHIIPNILPHLLVIYSTGLSSIIIMISSYAFLGLGLETGTAEWGAMFVNANKLLFSHPELLVYPGLCILFAAAGFNLFGEALRDLCAPKEGS